MTIPDETCHYSEPEVIMIFLFDLKVSEAKAELHHRIIKQCFLKTKQYTVKSFYFLGMVG